MFKKLLIVVLFITLMPILSAKAYGWTTQACKNSGCDCLGTSEEGKCVLNGDCSKCKIPTCRTHKSSLGTSCYLFDLAECNEVYEVYPNCPDSCNDLLDQFVKDCKNDTEGKWDYYKIPVSECCNKPAEKKPETVSQTISGRIIDLKTKDALPNVQVLIKCPNLKLTQTKYTSDTSGNFQITGEAEKGKEVTCRMIIGNDSHLRVHLTGVKPGNIGDIKIGTVAEYEIDMKLAIMQMLMDSGVAKDDAVAYVGYINFKYSGGNPSFEEVTPSFITGKMYGQNYQITMDPDKYLTDRETLYHEMTHAIAQKMFSDLAVSAGSHDIYEPLSNTGAFDEARAHFFAYLMMKKMGEYDASKDQFQDDKVISAITNNKVDIKGGQGSSVEASVVTFLKNYYVNIRPEDAWKDYMKTVNGCKETIGHSCQTIGEFIKQKGFLGNGARKDASRLGIKVDINDTCIIKENSSYELMDSNTIKLDSGDVGCGAKDIILNDIEIKHGGTQYIVSKTGDNTSISVLEGKVQATEINNKSTVEIASGNKAVYNPADGKFSLSGADTKNIEKFWESENGNKPSGSKVYFLIIGIFVLLGGIVAILFVKKLKKKK